MHQEVPTVLRRSFIAAASLAIAAGGLCTYVVRADDTKMDEKKMSPDESKMVMDQFDKMKKEAADSSDATRMKDNMAKTMVMDHMSMTLSKDSDFKEQTMALMDDADMKKVHEEAKAIADDPEKMKKMKEDIMSDPKEMREVIHHAMMMDMMEEKMAEKSSTGDKSSMSEMGSKIMDKMK